MVNISLNDEDYKAVVELAGKIQMAKKEKVALGKAAGKACRFILADPERLNAVVEDEHAS